MKTSEIFKIILIVVLILILFKGISFSKGEDEKDKNKKKPVKSESTTVLVSEMEKKYETYGLDTDKFVDIVGDTNVYGRVEDHVEHQQGRIPGTATDLNACAKVCTDSGIYCKSFGFNPDSKECWIFRGYFDSGPLPNSEGMYTRDSGEQWRSPNGKSISANKKK